MLSPVLLGVQDLNGTDKEAPIFSSANPTKLKAYFSKE